MLRKAWPCGAGWQPVGNPLAEAWRRAVGRRLPTGAQDAILPHNQIAAMLEKHLGLPTRAVQLWNRDQFLRTIHFFLDRQPMHLLICWRRFLPLCRRKMTSLLVEPNPG